MSQYYKPKRTRNLFDPLRHGSTKLTTSGSGQASMEPFKLSRSKIDLFLECPRCFYLDRRLGVGRPPGFPFNLNSAVDTLLKKEFDIHRAKGDAHPLMRAYKIDVVPFKHEKLDLWRDPFNGVSYLHPETNFLIYGAIDDVWVSPKKELHIVDYKATSKTDEVTLDAEWQDGYKRQTEIYQWLFRKNNFSVSSVGYFVYANALRDRKAFDGKLEFDVTVIPYTGSDRWVEKTLQEARDCLMLDEIPKASSQCDFCSYRNAAVSAIREKAESAKEGGTKTNRGTLF